MDFGILNKPQQKESNVIVWKEVLVDVTEHFKEAISQITAIKGQMEKLVVVDKESDEYCVLMGASASKLLKVIEEKRQVLLSHEIIRYVMDYVHKVDNTKKIFEKDLKDIKESASQKHAQFVLIQEQKRREQEKLAQEATKKVNEELRKDAQEKGIDEVQVPMPFIPKQPKAVKTEAGSASTRVSPYPEINVVDIELVPREYLVVSDAKVRDAWKRGIREIPGLDLKEVITTYFKT